MIRDGLEQHPVPKARLGGNGRLSISSLTVLISRPDLVSCRRAVPGANSSLNPLLINSLCNIPYTNASQNTPSGSLHLGVRLI